MHVRLPPDGISVNSAWEGWEGSFLLLQAFLMPCLVKVSLMALKHAAVLSCLSVSETEPNPNPEPTVMLHGRMLPDRWSVHMPLLKKQQRYYIEKSYQVVWFACSEAWNHSVSTVSQPTCRALWDAGVLLKSVIIESCWHLERDSCTRPQAVSLPLCRLSCHCGWWASSLANMTCGGWDV